MSWVDEVNTLAACLFLQPPCSSTTGVLSLVWTKKKKEQLPQDLGVFRTCCGPAPRCLKSTPPSRAVGVWSPSPRWPSSYQERSSSRLSVGGWTWWSLEGPPAPELRFRRAGAKPGRLWRRAGHQESITVADVKQRRHLPLVWS